MSNSRDLNDSVGSKDTLLSEEENDVLEMKDLKFDDCELVTEGDDLIIKIKGTDDSVRVAEYFIYGKFSIKNIKFNDKTMSHDDVVEHFKTVGTYINGTEKDDKLTSNAASWSKVVMNGYSGNDMISGTENAEILIGGKGNDTFIGNGGDDIYLFGKGDGQDLIDNQHYYLFDNSVLTK